MEMKEIRAVYTDDTVRVYQAYGEKIASEAIEYGAFGDHFSLDRMTWIKPSFLWMMYRSGWARKKGQEYVFAIDIKRDAFDELVEKGINSRYLNDEKLTIEEWKIQVKKSDVIIQWDPERDVYGNPLQYRSIQIGLRGEAIKKYAMDWIVRITDISDNIRAINEKIKNKQEYESLLPEERIYHRK